MTLASELAITLDSNNNNNDNNNDNPRDLEIPGWCPAGANLS